MVKDLFLELESIDIELSRLTLKNSNKNEREYRKYLVSKIERVSKEIMIKGKKEEIFRLEHILRNFLFNYEIKEYYKHFNRAMWFGMRKGLIVLSIIGVILVVVSLFLDFKAKSIKDNLIRDYEARLEEHNKNKIAEDNVEVENKNSEGYKNNNSATNKLSTIAILKISSIDLEAPIVNGEDNLKYVVAKYRNSPNFGEKGNTILAGHNNMAGSIFKNLYKVKVGDIVEVQYGNKIFKYKISQKEIVEPNDSSLLTQDLSKKEITLITCTNRAKQRLILKGELI